MNTSNLREVVILPIDPDMQARIEAKRREAIERLGEKYVYHPANREQRKEPPVRVLV